MKDISKILSLGALCSLSLVSCLTSNIDSTAPAVKSPSSEVVKPKVTAIKVTPNHKKIAADTKKPAYTPTYTNRSLPAAASSSAIAGGQKYSKDKYGMPTYPSTERTRYVRTTSYSHQENEKGAPGRKNASGGILKYGKVRSAAADWSRYPLGTKFRLKGLPHIYVVDDYGSALAGTNTLDIYHPSLSLMRNWNTRKTEVTVIQWGDWDRSLKILSGRTKYWHCKKMYTALKLKMQSGDYVKREVAPITKPL